MTEPDVLTRGLVRIYATRSVEVQALQGLDLRIERGEVTAIVGASGSGKSTLLGILSGIDRPTAGSAIVAGEDVGALTAKDRVRFRQTSVGFVWQDTARNLLPYLSLEENLAVPLLLRGERSADVRARRVAALLELFGLGEARRHRPADVPARERQLAAIAAAIANAPRVLLADEPTGELDEESAHQVLAALRTANREEGVTCVLVSHDAAIAEEVSRTVLIRDGRIATEILRSEIRDEDGRLSRRAEEFAVLDRFGRLQLPEHFARTLELRDRVRLQLEPDHLRLERGDDER